MASVPLRMPAHVQPRHLAAAAVAGAALVVVAAFDPSRHTLGPPCPLRLSTGLDCPLCGATRATHALTQGDLGRALDFNALYVLGLPVLLGVVGFWALRGRRPAWTDRRWAAVSLMVVAAAFTVVRNLPGSPWAFLGTTS